MPIHARTDIRQLVSSALTGVTAVTQVYEMRSAPYDTLPALNVKTLDEEVLWEWSAMGSSIIPRDLRLSIEIISWTLDDENDDLDDIIADVENVMNNSAAIDDVSWDLNLETVSFEYDRTAGYPYGLATMIYSLKYQTDMSDPQTIY